MNNALTSFALGQMGAENETDEIREKLEAYEFILERLRTGEYSIELDNGDIVTINQLQKFYEAYSKNKEIKNGKKEKTSETSARDYRKKSDEKAAKSKPGVEVLEAAVDEGTEDRSSDKKATEQKCELSSSLAVKRRRKLQKS